MRFAWEAFSIDHPEDWAPVVLSGSRQDGYVRLASTGRLSCQIRWKSAPSGAHLPQRLETYLARLAKDSRRAKTPFESWAEEREGMLLYEYGGPQHGRGMLFHDPATERVFFLELVSTKNDRHGGLLRQIRTTFQAGEERWALLGLDVTLPAPLKVERKQFLSGRTQLALVGRGVRVQAERWGFGTQLVEKHGFEAWAKAALNMERSDAREHPCGIELVGRRWPALPATVALVRLQPELNQIVAVKVRARDPRWRPTWDWLT